MAGNSEDRNPEANVLATMSPARVLMASILFVTLLVSGAWAAAVKYNTLYKFKGRDDGSRPIAGLIFDSAGNLYGTTVEGGAEGDGTVFMLTPTGMERVIHSFTGKKGILPYASLVFDADGSLYGTTVEGGADDWGTVFKLSPNGDGSWTESVIHSFNSDGTDGKEPYAALIIDTAGNLYGTTYGGGAYDCGTVFKLTQNEDGSWKETVLHSFNFRDGKFPDAALTLGSDGDLYGTTFAGGSNGGYGTVFKLMPNGEETVIHSFSRDHGDGVYPYGGVLFDSEGNLYGTTSAGGSHLESCNGSGCGIVFRLIPKADGSWTERVLHSFSGTDGASPLSGVTLDTAGNVYGATALGGSYNFGTVYELKSGANGRWKETVLHSFRNHPGDNPDAGVIFDGHGSFYGTTLGDGASNHGSVFKITP
jgi:uncharacterized repeat protein (TIGR03803 family)